MKVLIDTGVMSATDLITGCTQARDMTWAEGSTSIDLAGFQRVKRNSDPEQQREIDALWTVGRLARSGTFDLYTSSELKVELWRRPRGREALLNAFAKCPPKNCQSPIERTKLRSTIDWNQWIAKGGRADLSGNEFSQVSFFLWLSNLSPAAVEVIKEHHHYLKLDEFEIRSLEDLPWFQRLARALISNENLPDCFHVWTARRNGLAAFLTLEKKLPRTVRQIKMSPRQKLKDFVDVLRPTELLSSVGITELDPVPVQSDRFYSYFEIFQLQSHLPCSSQSIPTPAPQARASPPQTKASEPCH